MADLWSDRRRERRKAAEPLAVRMRPRTLDEFVGQGHIVGEGRLLRRMLAADALASLIFHGPPGTGKTTLAEVIANASSAAFIRENAAAVGVARIREISAQARADLEESDPANPRRTILFLDEIHRFSRAQQDVLLEDVERGVLVLIGATTENPLFSVNSALVSRSTLFRFEPLTEEDVVDLLRRALRDEERGVGAQNVEVGEGVLEHWARVADGDARRALTALEIAVRSTKADEGGAVRIDVAAAQESIQQKVLVYDGTGDEHYDVISAMIKSIRGSDPDAALYWIARMLEAGEDPRFIARRLAILASEDIGNADPRAMTVAASAWELVERIGMPEARITLAQCATYLALAPKSNASYKGIEEALADVRGARTQPVPLHLQSGYKAESEGSAEAGKGYEYSHDAGEETSLGGVTEQSYLGVEREYYRPSGRGMEGEHRKRLEEIRAMRARLRGEE